jgi:hypothetical protein
MLDFMRQMHERVLVARGHYLGKALSVRGLRIYQTHDQLGSEFLLIHGKTLGPSWPTIAKMLDESQIEYSLIEAGRNWLVVPDGERIRGIVSGLNKLAKQSASEEVFVPELGFVSAGIKKRFETRTLLGPVSIGIASLGLFFVPTSVPEQTNLEQSAQVEISCALDLSADELKDWVATSLEGREAANSAEVLVQSALGTLSLKIQQTLGSTQGWTGKIECEDGRSKQLHYRLDASAHGSLVEIRQELNP